MNLYLNTVVQCAPVAVYWNQGGADHCQVFRSEDDGKDFYAANNLWSQEGQIFAENGGVIPPPPEPPQSKEP